MTLKRRTVEAYSSQYKRGYAGLKKVEVHNAKEVMT